MVDFSFSEAYTLSLFKRRDKSLNLSKQLHLLLGLYVCDFLDKIEDIYSAESFQNSVNEYLLHFNKRKMKKNFLISSLENLRNLNLLSVQKERVFNNFSLLHFTLTNSSLIKLSSSGDLNAFLLQSLEEYTSFESPLKLKEIIEFFNKKLFSLFNSYKRKHSKYELRFFWPETEIPEICNYNKDLFNRKNYDKEHNKDKYIINSDDLISKLRKGRLKVKERSHNFAGISCFTQKIKEVSSQEFLTLHPSIEILKKRYIHKISAHSKIEFSLIKVENKKWKTICLESNKIEIVLALSFLINPLHGERLTYIDFLKKHV